MSRPPSLFRQGDVTRLLRAAKAAGYEEAEVKFDKDGQFRLVARTVHSQVVAPEKEDLARDFAKLDRRFR